MKTYVSLIAILIALTLGGCTMKYSFTGASIGADVKTVKIDYIINRAKVVNPTLSQTVTEELKNKFSRELGLTISNESADLEFSGQITGYTTAPKAIKQSDDGKDYASQNRFTLTVRVKFVNNTDHEQDFDSSFSAYVDYDSTQDFNSVEDTLVDQALEQVLDDIFNKSVANW